jgi:hypothetical protein
VVRASTKDLLWEADQGREYPMKRREFIRNVAAAGAGALMFRSTPGIFAQTVPGRIEILMDEPLGTISPNIYGHFAENLSGVIYDGIWVGENSKVPNVGGIRKELVDEMKTINPSIVRFPGAVSRIATIGATESDLSTNARDGRISGMAERRLGLPTHTAMIQIASGRTSLYSSAGRSGLNLISQPTCVAARPGVQPLD